MSPPTNTNGNLNKYGEDIFMRISIWEIMTRFRLFIEVHPFRLKVENIQIK